MVQKLLRCPAFSIVQAQTPVTYGIIDSAVICAGHKMEQSSLLYQSTLCWRSADDTKPTHRKQGKALNNAYEWMDLAIIKAEIKWKWLPGSQTKQKSKPLQ